MLPPTVAVKAISEPSGEKYGSVSTGRRREASRLAAGARDGPEVAGVLEGDEIVAHRRAAKEARALSGLSVGSRSDRTRSGTRRRIDTMSLTIDRLDGLRRSRPSILAGRGSASLEFEADAELHLTRVERRVRSAELGRSEIADEAVVVDAVRQVEGLDDSFD